MSDLRNLEIEVEELRKAADRIELLMIDQLNLLSDIKAALSEK